MSRLINTVGIYMDFNNENSLDTSWIWGSSNIYFQIRCNQYNTILKRTSNDSETKDR